MAFKLALARLERSFSPSVTLNRIRGHEFTCKDLIYLVHFLFAVFWFWIMETPSFPVKILIPLLWMVALVLPATSQFFLPATPILSYLLAFYSSRFIAPALRPAISVSLLPTLESVLYGANISDLLTRTTHPILDILAWIPYGVGHFTLPFLIALAVWLLRSHRALVFWAAVFGWMNLTGVLIQILVPCAPPWYEVLHGLVPANYAMKGSPAGLARIDALFASSTYTNAFTNSPMVFGAFPSLHAGSATMEALFVAHFFPTMRRVVWVYAGVLYWATMYLTHHYLIDVVGGACLSTAFFYLMLPEDLKGDRALEPPANFPGVGSAPSRERGQRARPARPRSKYNRYYAPNEATGADQYELAEQYELPDDEEGAGVSDGEGEQDITYRSPLPNAAAEFGDQQAHAYTSQPQTHASKFASQQQAKSGHRHTASIASLIRSEERGPDEGWSPVRGAFVGREREARV